MDDGGSDYGDQIAFYIVGTSQHESLEKLEADREKHGYPWPVAYADEGMLERLSIYTQPSKVVFNGDGVITHRYGIGKGDYESWSDLFEDISAN